MVQITNSLPFLKSVRPVPSTKHIGKILHTKMESRINAVTTVQILKCIYAFTFLSDFTRMKERRHADQDQVVVFQVFDGAPRDHKHGKSDTDTEYLGDGME